ncbi:MAG: NAD-dependent epimerase/dehydratase family protein, partial [Vicinamibacteria bacterium]
FARFRPIRPSHNPETGGDTLRPNMKGTIAIVGANGFVGRHLLQRLARQGRPALGIVRSDEGARVVRDAGGIPAQVRDLEKASTAGLVPALSDCAGLVYTASVSPGPGAADRTNPAGLQNVIEVCREAGVPKIVFLSGLGLAHYGMNPHCTNPYFLAKMAGEVALFRSDRCVTVFRPSYIFGSGDEFLTPLVRRMRTSSLIEIPGDGAYRLQPISVQDAARAILASMDGDEATSPRVVDLVGPEVLSYRELILRTASLMSQEVDIRERPLEEAIAQARESGYFGLKAHDLDCLLCDEVSDPRHVQSLTGGRLESVNEMVERTIEALSSAEKAG